MQTLRAVTVFCFAFITLFLLNACQQDSNVSTGPTPVLSNAPNTTYPMPPLGSASGDLGWTQSELNNLRSQQFHRARIADFKGQILVLDFYATWCMPCRESIPHLNQLQQRYGTQGLRIVGLNVGGADDRVKVPEFARELQIKYDLGFPERALTDLLLSDDPSIPQTFVFDRDGRLIKRLIGYGPPTAAMLDETIRSAIS